MDIRTQPTTADTVIIIDQYRERNPSSVSFAGSVWLVKFSKNKRIQRHIRANIIKNNLGEFIFSTIENMLKGIFFAKYAVERATRPKADSKKPTRLIGTYAKSEKPRI